MNVKYTTMKFISFYKAFKYLFDQAFYSLNSITIIKRIINIKYLQDFNFPPELTVKRIQDLNKSKLSNEMKRALDALKSEKEHRSKAYFHSKKGHHNIEMNKQKDEKYENHIIVCGIVAGMKSLLMPLRVKSLKTIVPIVILYSDPIPTEIWKQINYFP